jgi:hypothetical protein
MAQKVSRRNILGASSRKTPADHNAALQMYRRIHLFM